MDFNAGSDLYNCLRRTVSNISDEELQDYMRERKRLRRDPMLSEDTQIVARLLSGQLIEVMVRRGALLSELIRQIWSASFRRTDVIPPVTTLIMTQTSGIVRHTLLQDSDQKFLDLGYIDSVQVQALVETMPDNNKTYLKIGGQASFGCC